MSNYNIGILVSMLDHSVVLSYNGEGMMLPPRGKIEKVNRLLLGALPKGVRFIPYS